LRSVVDAGNGTPDDGRRGGINMVRFGITTQATEK
jgi:hypothetical protein